MIRVSTYNLDLSHVFSFTVIQRTGQVVLCGNRLDNTYSDSDGNEGHEPWSIFIYTVTGDSLKERRHKLPCQHGWHIHPLGIVIKSEEKLALSCAMCREIKLLDMRTKDVTIAFRSEYNVDIMCYGEDNTLFVYCLGDGSVLELDYSTSSFKLGRTINSGLSDCTEMCYLPTPYIFLALSVCGEDVGEDDIIRVVSVHRDKIMWDLTGVVDGLKMNPAGLLFSPCYGLLVSDMNNSRVLVINPIDGSHLQTINLPSMGEIYGIFLHHDEVIMRHDTNAFKISLFALR